MNQRSSTPTERFSHSESRVTDPSSYYFSPEAVSVDKWFEDLNYYERTLEEISRTKLDDGFNDELKAIDIWFGALNGPERTSAVYSLLQHSSPIQIRFFMTVLQHLTQRENVNQQQPSRAPSLTAQYVEVSRGHTNAPTRAPPGIGLGGLKSRRLYDRYSAPLASEKFSSLFSDSMHSDYSTPTEEVDSLYSTNRSSSSNGLGASQSSRTPLSLSFPRPATPVDEAISSADWSTSPNRLGRPMSMPIRKEPIDISAFSPQIPSARPLGLDTPSTSEKQQPNTYAAFTRNSPAVKRPSSPVVRAQSPMTSRHPWSVESQMTPVSHYFSDISDDYGSGSDAVTPQVRPQRQGSPMHSPSQSPSGANSKEKGKIPESVDLSALNDIPSWLRSLRLHKYTPLFEKMKGIDMIKLTDEELTSKGVVALGARRKMLKVFEMMNAELEDRQNGGH